MSNLPSKRGKRKAPASVQQNEICIGMKCKSIKIDIFLLASTKGSAPIRQMISSSLGHNIKLIDIIQKSYQIAKLQVPQPQQFQPMKTHRRQMPHSKSLMRHRSHRFHQNSK